MLMSVSCHSPVEGNCADVCSAVVLLLTFGLYSDLELVEHLVTYMTFPTVYNEMGTELMVLYNVKPL